MRNHRRHRITVQFGENEMEFLIPYSDAKKDLAFNRIELDVRNGKPGHVGECMDHKCFARLQQQFPHPAYSAEVTADRVWIVDKVNKFRQPTHCVRYIRPTRDRLDIRTFDTQSKRSILSGQTDVVIERPIHLLAPRPTHKVNPWGGKTHPDRRDGSRKKPALHVGDPRNRGALARKIRAGLLSVQPA